MKTSIRQRLIALLVAVAAGAFAAEPKVFLQSDFKRADLATADGLGIERVTDANSPLGSHLNCRMSESGLVFKEFAPSPKAAPDLRNYDVLFNFRIEAEKDGRFDLRLRSDLSGQTAEIAITIGAAEVRITSEGFIPSVSGTARLNPPIAPQKWRQCAVSVADGQLTLSFDDDKNGMRQVIAAQLPAVPSAGINFFGHKGAPFSIANLTVRESAHSREFLEVAASNRVPYISTYYVTPKVSISEKAVINYYVTDFDQKEYLLGDTSETFTIDYWVNGAKTTLNKVPAGDNSIALGTLPKGKVLFALQATDKRGLKSHRLYSEFLIVDVADEKIPDDKVLNPDLAQFKISSDDTHPVETTAGLTEMLKFAGERGYRKVVLPKGGRYRIDENSTVKMATRLTLDMNGSTFKLNPNANSGALMLEFVNCFDSHVINGTFEGDIKEHDYANSPKNAEWINCMSISENCEYCSVADVLIKDVTGYGTCTNHRHSFTRSQDVGEFLQGDVDEQGRDVPSEIRTTSKKFVTVDEYVKSCGFMQLGIYLGYQGNSAGHWVYKAHFYDADKKYIESIEGYLYRRLYPPANAKFARFTLLSDAKPANLAVYNFRSPYNCAFINIKHENIRCVGMALSGFVNLLVEGCTFENCGQKLARCAFDAEDGWDLMQDLTFRKNVFGTNPANEFLTCGGHNFMMENNTMKAYIWERTNSYVFRGNTLKSAEYRVGRGMRTGFVRVQNNTHQGVAAIRMTANDSDRDYCMNGNVCENGISMTGRNVYAFRCKISGGAISGKAVDCDISKVSNGGGWFDIQNSRVNNCTLKTSGAGVISTIRDSKIANTKLMTQGAAFLLDGNTVTDSECAAGGDWSDGHEFVLRKNVWMTSAADLINVGNSYKQIVLEGNTINSSNKEFAAIRLCNPVKSSHQIIEMKDNKFSGAGGIALKADRVPAPPCELTINLSGNTFNGLEKLSSNLTSGSSIKIIDK